MTRSQHHIKNAGKRAVAARIVVNARRRGQNLAHGFGDSVCKIRIAVLGARNRWGYDGEIEISIACTPIEPTIHTAKPNPTMNPYVLLGIAVIIEVIATTALQYSEGFTNPFPTAVVVIGYLISFYLLSQILSQLPIGPVYATWSAGAIVLIAAIGAVFLGQQLDLAGVAGIALIIGGVYLLNVVSDISVH